MNITFNNPISFKAGLNSQIIGLQKEVTTESIEKYLFNNNHIQTDFKNNKPIAIASFLSINILNNLDNFLKNLKFWTPSINVYNKNDLLAGGNIHNFCIQEKQLVLKNKLPFEKGSIFYMPQNSLEEMDAINEQDYAMGKRSSNHFLAEIIHEMMHVIYLKHIVRKYPYQEKQILKLLENKTFESSENSVIENTIGKYATTPSNQYHEVFAETFTQLFCNAISNNSCSLAKNPIDGLKNYSKEFRVILKKVLDI